MEVKEKIFTVCGTPTYVAPEILAETGNCIVWNVIGQLSERDWIDINIFKLKSIFIGILSSMVNSFRPENS